jgi:hypothetical protein
MNDQEAFAIAVEEAKISYKEGGVPVSIFPHTPASEVRRGEEVAQTCNR